MTDDNREGRLGRDEGVGGDPAPAVKDSSSLPEIDSGGDVKADMPLGAPAVEQESAAQPISAVNENEKGANATDNFVFPNEARPAEEPSAQSPSINWGRQTERPGWSEASGGAPYTQNLPQQHPYGGETGPAPGAQPQYQTPPSSQQPGYPYQPPMPPYGQTPPQAYGQRPYYPPNMAFTPPQKKRAPVALVVFVIILIALSLFTITGYAVYAFTTRQSNTNTQIPSVKPEIPYLPDGKNDREPDYDDGVVVPDPNWKAPDIDVVPNKDGITIGKRPTTPDLEAKDVYKKVAPSTVTVIASRDGSFEESMSNTGTGIIATSDGYIITNSHVVFDSKSSAVKITTFDEKEYDAVVVGVDRTTDLAVLKTNDHQFTPAEFGSMDDLVIGEWVIAIGNPGGASFSSSLTRGVISGLNRKVGQYSEKGMTYIQTDAAINPGNSGGPLVNMHGQVIGINSSKIITSGYEGMGFAIPVSKADVIINELLSEGFISGRVRMGIKGTDVPDVQKSMYNLPGGFAIAEIDEDSALYGSEAQVGDIIVAIDDKKVTGISSISAVLLDYAPGDTVTLTLYSTSKNEEYKVDIRLLEDKGETQK